MNTLTKFCVLCLCLWNASSARAASTLDIEALKPFLDPYTVVVVQLNVDELDVAAAADALVELWPVPRELWAAPVQRAKQVVEPRVREFREAGGRRCYALVSLAWLGTEPPIALIAPVAADADAERLTAVVKSAVPRWQTRLLHGCVVAAPPAVLGRLAAHVPALSHERWQAAFAGAPSGIARAVMMPYLESDRVIEELIPTLPRMLGGGPGSVFAHGFRWGTLSLKLPPDGVVALTIQSASPEAAAALRKVIEKALVAGGQMPGVRESIPAWDALGQLLLPVTAGDRLHRELHLTELSKLVAGFQPVLEETRSKAQRIATMNQLKQIGLGLMIHANDQGGRLPSHLADVMKSLGDARLLLRPGQALVPPADLAAQARDAQVAWIDQHSPFVFVRPGVLLKELKSPQTTVLVYERPQAEADSQVGVLFGDGHVESVTPEKLERMLEDAAK